MEMSIKLICQLFAVAFLLLWSKKVEGFFFFFPVREEKNRYRIAHRADPEVGRQEPSGQDVVVWPSPRGGSVWE